jgi:hypothetical protein
LATNATNYEGVVTKLKPSTTSVYQVKDHADRFWEKTYQLAKDGDTSLLWLAMSQCNKADAAVLQHELEQRWRITKGL